MQPILLTNIGPFRGWERPLITKTDNLLPTEIKIAIPALYKDYLASKRWYPNTTGWFGLIPLYVGWGLLAWQHRRSGLSMLFVDMVPPVGAIILAIQKYQHKLRREMCYDIDDKHMVLIRWQPKDRGWEWYDMRWTRNVVARIEKDTWRSLPALRITMHAKSPKDTFDLWMVYAYEDAVKVDSVVLPLMEKYQRQYRHDFWANEPGK